MCLCHNYIIAAPRCQVMFHVEQKFYNSRAISTTFHVEHAVFAKKKSAPRSFSGFRYTFTLTVTVVIPSDSALTHAASMPARRDVSTSRNIEFIKNRGSASAIFARETTLSS